MKQIKIEKIYTVELTSTELKVISKALDPKNCLYIDNEKKITSKLVYDIKNVMNKL